jgi:hypothetical protein
MRKVGLFVAILGLATACDEDNPARHLDGGTTDSPEQMIDAPVAPEPVTVTVKSVGIGQAGVVVHFQKADSTLVATEMTDATGVASHVLEAGGYVTVLNPFPPAPAGLPNGPSQDIRTFAGVKPGDHLRVEETAGEETPPINMTLTLPPQTDGNIAHYDIVSSCGGNQIDFSGSGGSNPTGVVSFYNCTTTDILVIAKDDTYTPYKFFFVPNQAITADGALDYSGQTLGDLTTRTYDVGDKPTNVFGIDVRQVIGTARGELVEYSSATTGTTPATASLTFPAIANGLSLITISAYTGMMQHYGLEWGALATTPYSTDFGGHMLPEISAYSFDAATHTISWTATGGAAPDFVEVELSGYRNTSTEVRRVEWKIVAPYTAGTTTLPTLPAGTFDLNFTEADGVSVRNILVGDIPNGGYDAVRAPFFAIDPYERPEDVVVGASGTAQIAYTSVPSVARPKPATTPKKTHLQHRTQSTH